MANSTESTLFGLTPTRFNTQSPQSKKSEVYGLGYPLHKNKTEGGYFTKVTGKELIIGAIKQLVYTEKGERVMLPDFGCSLKRFLFEPLDETVFSAIKREIIEAFSKYIVGARILSLNVFSGKTNGPSESNSLLVVLTVQIATEDLLIFDVPILIS